MTAPLLIVRTGATLSEIAAERGDFPDWICAGMGVAVADAACVAVFDGDPLPAPADFAAIVVTGSSAMVTDREDWSERTTQWLPAVVDAGTPLLGICYGHQLLAVAHGGEVGRNPSGREIGTIEVVNATDAKDALLGGLPARPCFQATHRESVLRLPIGAKRLASNDADPNQAFALGSRAWGVQFHPEFPAEVMRGYLEARRASLSEEGLDPDQLIADTRDTPAGPLLLRRFAEIAGL